MSISTYSRKGMWLIFHNQYEESLSLWVSFLCVWSLFFVFVSFLWESCVCVRFWSLSLTLWQRIRSVETQRPSFFCCSFFAAFLTLFKRLFSSISWRGLSLFFSPFPHFYNHHHNLSFEAKERECDGLTLFEERIVFVRKSEKLSKGEFSFFFVVLGHQFSL